VTGINTEVSARPLPGAGALARSTPYPWPYDGAFDARRCALLVLDTASPRPPSDDPAWKVAGELAAAVGMVIEIHSSPPPRLGRHAPRGPVDRRFAGQLITASAWDAFYGTALDQFLRANGRDLLVLCGAWLEVGVHSTMRAANDRGYECVLVADACVAGDETLRAASISSIEMSGGIFGAVADSTDLLTLLANSTR
jgi:biuret amidohydrolase